MASAVSTSGIVTPLFFATSSTPPRFEADPAEHSSLRVFQSSRQGLGASGCPVLRHGDSVLPRHGIDELWYIPQNACPVSEQPVRAPAFAHAWRARHGPYIASCVEGVAGCNEGPAMLGRLHDHYGPGKAGYDAISGRESPCQGRLAQVVFGDQGSVASDRLEEAPIASWVYDGVSIGVQTASRSTPRTSRSPLGLRNTCKRSIR